MQPLKFSIITSSFNQGDFIEKNIRSVLSQDYDHVEHLIIDGGSKDSTVSILQKYPHLKWVSEKDEGQADAINKGLRMATGDIIGWLNSDDFFEPDILKFISDLFKDPKVQWIVGELNQVDQKNGIVTPVVSPKITYRNLLSDPDIVKQPCTFIRKSIIEKVGGIDKNLFMVMDYDLFLRISRITEPLMVKRTFANFVIHPQQKTNLKNNLLQLKEIIQLLKREKAPFFIRWRIIFRKRRSVIKKKVKNMIFGK